MRSVFSKLILLLSIFPMMLVSQVSDEKVNQVDAKGMKQGIWKKYHPGDSVLRYSGRFIDNVPVDTFLYYYPTGEMQSQVVHVNGKESYASTWHKNGNLMATGSYFGQLKDSTWKFFDQAGILRSEENYIEGKRYGIWKSYFYDGKILEVQEWENDVESGPYKRYHHNGKVERTANYLLGALEGEVIDYHDNGNVRQQGQYYHDVKQGVWKHYDENGELLTEITYVNGRPQNVPERIEQGDTTNWFRKDVYTESDFLPDYSKIPTKEEEGKKKKKDRK